MALSEDVLNGLADMLPESTARITQLDGGLPAGSAFFVSDSLLVTNRHVVAEHTGPGPHVLVRAFGTAQPVPGTVLPPSEHAPELDIALVRVQPDPNRPALLIRGALGHGSYLIAGYPKENFYTDLAPGAQVSPPTAGAWSLDIGTTKPQLLRLSGLQIRPGHSGGPVLHAATGAVVAVTVYSEDVHTDIGGAALPLQLALDAYPELAAIAADAPPATGRHKAILGRTAWEALGQVWSREEQLDIRLTGTRSCWRISVRGSDEGPDRFARDLGDDMSEVIVQWARNSGRRDESEVLLLGRLLSGALFPPEIAALLPRQALTDDDPVLVRLHVDPSGPLAELPWELATDPTDNSRFLSATDGYAFVRVNTEAPVAEDVEAVAPLSREQQATVLNVIVQPDDTTRWPQVMEAGSLRPWPASAAVVEQLQSRQSSVRGAAGQRLFESEAPLVNPAFYDLKLRSDRGTVDIVHYVGFGYQEPEDGRRSALDRSWIALGGRGSDDLKAHKAMDVLREIGKLRPRLLVMEFGTPRLDWPNEQIGGQRYQPIGPALLGGVDLAHAEAMICTRPVHPLQYDRFNDLLYSQLGEGQTMENAVQRARGALQAEYTVDYAGFGWFAVTTGDRLRRRFFDRPGTGAPGAMLGSPAAAETSWREAQSEPSRGTPFNEPHSWAPGG